MRWNHKKIVVYELGYNGSEQCLEGTLSSVHRGREVYKEYTKNKLRPMYTHMKFRGQFMTKCSH